MKIFILEDLSERQEAFRNKFKGHDIIISDNVDEAKEILKNNSFDLICLDHDLGGEAFVDTKYYNTGTTLAKFIAENEIVIPVIIHSLNPVGAKSMQGYLPWAEIIPGYFNLKEE